MKTLKESILDDDIFNKTDSIIALNNYNKILDKRAYEHTPKPIDMFGRELHEGDICLAYLQAEFHFIQIKEIKYDGKWAFIVPTEDYSYIAGNNEFAPFTCILIPKKHYGNFLKFMKDK